MASMVLKWWMKIQGGGSAYVAPAPTTNNLIDSTTLDALVDSTTSDNLVES